MEKISVGRRLYTGVITVFLLFAVAFIIFQQTREKQFKIDTLNLRLQDYNVRMDDALKFIGNRNETTLTEYVKTHNIRGLRVTLIDTDGNVLFDNRRKDYLRISNHINRPEVEQALKFGSGSAVERNSKTLGGDFFYSATYFPSDSFVIRSALPYNNDLVKSLKADQHYLWFALVAMAVLLFLLYRFTNSLGQNITKLRLFAYKADRNESLDTEDLINFPDDELGEIAERIIKIYKRLQSTREEQDILKRQLTQNIAHELKTPVASIQGYLETILTNPDIQDDTRLQFLQRCFAQCQRLTSLLMDISTLNKMDDGAQLIDKTELDIVLIVNNIAKETALQMQEKGMKMEINMPAELRIKCNQSLIYSIFRNLVDNAIAYAGHATCVTISAKEDGDRWLFRFCDNGIGVPNAHLSRIFERFYRVDKGRSRKMGGTGLGLAIVKNAVIIHGGSISVKNLNTGGLCFDFSLSKQ